MRQSDTNHIIRTNPVIMLLLLFLAFCSTVIKDGHAEDQNIRLRGGFLGPAGPILIGNMQQPSLVGLPPPKNGQAPFYVYCYPGYPGKNVVNAYPKDAALKTKEPRPKTNIGSSQRQPWLVVSASSEGGFPHVILSGGIVKSLGLGRDNVRVGGHPSVFKPPPIGKTSYPSGQHDASESSPSPVPSSPTRDQNVLPYHLLPGSDLSGVGQDLPPPPGVGGQSGERMKRPNLSTDIHKNAYSLNAADESFRPYSSTNPFEGHRPSMACGGKTDIFGKCEDKKKENEIKKKDEKDKKDKGKEKKRP